MRSVVFIAHVFYLVCQFNGENSDLVLFLSEECGSNYELFSSQLSADFTETIYLLKTVTRTSAHRVVFGFSGVTRIFETLWLLGRLLVLILVLKLDGGFKTLLSSTLWTSQIKSHSLPLLHKSLYRASWQIKTFSRKIFICDLSERTLSFTLQLKQTNSQQAFIGCAAHGLVDICQTT